MKYRVVEGFRAQTSRGEPAIIPGQIVTLPKEKALALLNEGKIVPSERTAYRIYSEILEAFLWVVYAPEDMKAMREHGVTEAIYTKQDIAKLKKLPKEALKGIHMVKEVFPMSTIEKVKHNEKE